MIGAAGVGVFILEQLHPSMPVALLYEGIKVFFAAGMERKMV